MRLVRQPGDAVSAPTEDIVMHLSWDDVAALGGALREAREVVRGPDLELRVGVPPEEASCRTREILDVLDDSRFAPDDESRLFPAPAAAEELTVAAPRDEWLVLAAALRAVLGGLEDWEFFTRMGLSVDDARSLRERVLAGLGA